MDASPTPIPRQRWFLLGLFIFFVVVNTQYAAKILDPEHHNRSAFLRWSNQILDLHAGADIWERHGYPNPPIMALVLSPLVFLGPVAGALVWFYLKVAMAVLAVYLVLRMLDRPGRPFPVWGKILAIMFSLRAIQGDLMHGNVNLFILFLVVGALYAFARGRDVLAGLALGLAIACKVTPALFVPYFLWKRAWKLSFASLLGVGLFSWVLPGLFLGWHNNNRNLVTWYHTMVQPFATQGEVTYCDHKNQSLPGLAHRLLTRSPSFARFDFEKDAYVAVAYHNVVDWSPEAVRWLLLGAMGLFASLGMWVCRAPISAPTDWRLLGEFSLVFLGMLLFSERTWKHHCVTLLVPFAVLAYHLSAQWHDRRMRWYLGGTLAAAMGLMLSTSSGVHTGNEKAGDLMMAYGAYAWAFLLLAAGMCVLLRRHPPQGREQCERMNSIADYASMSVTTDASGTRGSGRPIRSVSSVSGSMPSKW